MIAGYARSLRNIHAAWILSKVSCFRAELSLALRQGDVVPTSCREEADNWPGSDGGRMAREASHLEGECTPPLERALELPDYHAHRLAEQDFLRMETACWYHE